MWLAIYRKLSVVQARLKEWESVEFLGRKRRYKFFNRCVSLPKKNKSVQSISPNAMSVCHDVELPVLSAHVWGGES